ncbi:MAG: hypothetical protein P8Y66_03120 [Nitrospirota bacterium]|jgi:hypothetical protein
MKKFLFLAFVFIPVVSVAQVEEPRWVYLTDDVGGASVSYDPQSMETIASDTKSIVIRTDYREADKAVREEKGCAYVDSVVAMNCQQGISLVLAVSRYSEEGALISSVTPYPARWEDLAKDPIMLKLSRVLCGHTPVETMPRLKYQ